MDMEAMAATPVGRSIVRALGTAMDSRLRHRFFGPLTTLQGADLHPGQTVLEVGCGSGRLAPIMAASRKNTMEATSTCGIASVRSRSIW